MASDDNPETPTTNLPAQLSPASPPPPSVVGKPRPMSGGNGYVCSFCSPPGDNATTLVANPAGTAFICAACTVNSLLLHYESKPAEVVEMAVSTFANPMDVSPQKLRRLLQEAVAKRV